MVELSKSQIPSNIYRILRLATVSTCVEATRCKYAPDLEAIEVDISTTASVEDNKYEERRPPFRVFFAA
jgi:hypothetical protein